MALPVVIPLGGRRRRNVVVVARVDSNTAVRDAQYGAEGGARGRRRRGGCRSVLLLAKKAQSAMRSCRHAQEGEGFMQPSSKQQREGSGGVLEGEAQADG